MASIDNDDRTMVMRSVRRQVRHEAQIMLYAAGLTALGLVVVAASVVTLL